MRRLVVVFVGALIASAPASGIVGERSAGTRSYRDTRAENPAAPDITDVRVSNDNSGRITFRIASPNRPTLRDDMRISVWIDADDDPATGVGGMDYRLLSDYYLHGDRAAWVYRCAASTCSSAGLPRIAFPYTAGATIAVDQAVLGGTPRFRFRIVVTDGVAYDPVTRKFDLTNAHVDTAPDADPPWPYEPDTTRPARLVVERVNTSPAVPRAGKRFTVRLSAFYNDTGAPATRGTIGCGARISGKPLRSSARGFSNGVARCTWKVPPNARGKTLRFTVRIASSGRTGTAAFAKRVG